jgi:DNA invertase Pin-like site-specific DNA recombinase
MAGPFYTPADDRLHASRALWLEIEASRVRELKAQGMRPSDIAKALKIGRASVYRLLAS